MQLTTSFSHLENVFFVLESHNYCMVMYHVPVLRYTSAYITLLLEEQFILDISVSAHIACKGHRRISRALLSEDAWYSLATLLEGLKSQPPRQQVISVSVYLK